MIIDRNKTERAAKCQLCKMPFTDGQRANFIDGQFYHQKCMNLYEKLTNSEGQLGEKSLLNRFEAASKHLREQTEGAEKTTAPETGKTG